MSTFSGNSSIKVNRAISGADTVNSNCYAEVSYAVTTNTPTTAASANFNSLEIPPMFTRIFGPGQTIPATFTVTATSGYNAGWDYLSVTYTLLSGVEFINTP